MMVYRLELNRDSSWAFAYHAIEIPQGLHLRTDLYTKTSQLIEVHTEEGCIGTYVTSDKNVKNGTPIQIYGHAQFYSTEMVMERDLDRE